MSRNPLPRACRHRRDRVATLVMVVSSDIVCVTAACATGTTLGADEVLTRRQFYQAHAFDECRHVVWPRQVALQLQRQPHVAMSCVVLLKVRLSNVKRIFDQTARHL